MSWERLEPWVSQDYTVATRGPRGERVAVSFTVEGTHPTNGRVKFPLDCVIPLDDDEEPSGPSILKWNTHCPDVDREAVKVAGVLLAYMHGYLDAEAFEGVL